MKNKKKLYILDIPKVSNEFAMFISQSFPQKDSSPDVTRDQEMYNAGQRSVVKFIEHHASGTVTSGDTKDLRPDTKGSLLDKLLGIIR